MFVDPDELTNMEIEVLCNQNIMLEGGGGG